jgi:hypothetical protein
MISANVPIPCREWLPCQNEAVKMLRRILNTRPNVAGVAHYRRDQWDRLRSICLDADKLSPHYDSWLSWTENLTKELENRGVKVVKVEVDVEAFVAWCYENKFIVDGNARRRYVNHQLLVQLLRKKETP